MIPDPVGEFGQEVSLAGANVEKADCDTIQVYIGAFENRKSVIRLIDIPDRLDGAAVVRVGVIGSFTCTKEGTAITDVRLLHLKWKDPTQIQTNPAMYFTADTYTYTNIINKEGMGDVFLPEYSDLGKFYIDIPYSDDCIVQARNTLYLAFKFEIGEENGIDNAVFFVEFKRKKI